MITIMTEADLDQATIIEKSSNPSPWSRSFFEGEILSSFSYPFVAREGNRALGFIVLWKILSEGHIADFAVCVEHRGEGIGSALLHHALDFCVRKGISEVTVTVKVNNFKAISIYRKAGFIQETTFSDFGNSLLLFLACDGFSAKEPNFEMPLHQSDLSYMREVLEPVFASKICRETRRATLALEMSDSSVYQHHIQRLNLIQGSLRFLQRKVG